MENSLLKFKKKYKNIRFFDDKEKQELKELINKNLPYIMENKENLALDIIKGFEYYLKEYDNINGVVSKEKIKSIVNWYRDIFEDKNIGLLIKKYCSKDKDFIALIVKLSNKLNLENIRNITVECIGGL